MFASAQAPQKKDVVTTAADGNGCVTTSGFVLLFLSINELLSLCSAILVMLILIVLLY